MVFAQLPAHEKEAFFSLLDELSGILNEFIDWLNLSCRYFSSRPDLLGHASSSEGSAGASAGAAVQRAISSNPEAASRLISAGLKHGAPKTGPYAAVGLFFYQDSTIHIRLGVLFEKQSALYTWPHTLLNARSH